MTADEETETEVRSKNTPAITDYRHGCSEKQENENLRDYNFKHYHTCLIVIQPDTTESNT